MVVFYLYIYIYISIVPVRRKLRYTLYSQYFCLLYINTHLEFLECKVTNKIHASVTCITKLSSASRIKNFKALFKVISIGLGRRKTSGSSSFTNTKKIFTLVHKRNKTTKKRNEIKHNERNKKVNKTKTNLYLRALLLTNPTKNMGSSFL
jgi:hypothetical protein